ncbi:unnamed protein product [Symbiodinium natans]|uniref:HXXEE domain-containing protein n=1 Tax=Symbiodinium natans TaxID=878477 RepID=A0A812R8W9_9DINO|nr:unnamed protein product [Symbiodinium natans]
MTAQDLARAAWFDAYWMLLGPLLALLFCALPLPQHGSFQQASPCLRYLTRGLLLVYTIHQLEEHGWDLYGNRYSFISWMNSVMAAKSGLAITVRQVTLVNVLTVWVGEITACLSAEIFGRSLPVAFHWALATANAVVHLSFVAATRTYNPGAGQSVIQFALGACFFSEYFWTRGFSFPLLVLLFVLGGPVGHLGGIVLPLKLGVSDPVFALFQLLVAVALPALLSFLLERPAASEPKGKQKDD